MSVKSKFSMVKTFLMKDHDYLSFRSQSNVWVGIKGDPMFTDGSSYDLIITGSLLDQPCVAIDVFGKPNGDLCSSTKKFICMTPGISYPSLGRGGSRFPILGYRSPTGPPFGKTI